MSPPLPKSSNCTLMEDVKQLTDQRGACRIFLEHHREVIFPLTALRVSRHILDEMSCSKSIHADLVAGHGLGQTGHDEGRPACARGWRRSRPGRPTHITQYSGILFLQTRKPHTLSLVSLQSLPSTSFDRWVSGVRRFAYGPPAIYT